MSTDGLRRLVRRLAFQCEEAEKRDVVHVVLNSDGYVEVWTKGRVRPIVHQVSPGQRFADEELAVGYTMEANGFPKTRTIDDLFFWGLDFLDRIGIPISEASDRLAIHLSKALGSTPEESGVLQAIARKAADEAEEKAQQSERELESERRSFDI
jgi:hypothetical protein